MPRVGRDATNTHLLNRLVANPARTVMLGFAAVILVGTLALMTPAAAEPGQTTTFLTALFTATSATCVTGLVTVDTATHWSTFGELVILAPFAGRGRHRRSSPHRPPRPSRAALCPTDSRARAGGPTAR